MNAPVGFFARFAATLRWLMLAVAVAAAAGAWWVFIRDTKSGHSHAMPKYYCPMHPQIVSPDKGECPICHMDLEPIPESRTNADDSASSSSSAPPMVSGLSAVSVNLDRIQTSGVKLVTIVEEDSNQVIRASSTLALAESGVAEVHAKVPCFVENISAKETGLPVKAGQLLASLYCPDVFTSGVELLAASKYSEHSKIASDNIRKRMELMGVAPKAIDSALVSGNAPRHIGLTAPISGFITKKNVVQGSFVSPETTLFEVADLSKLYLVIEPPLQQAASISVGTKGHFEPEGSTRSIDLQIDLAYPQTDATARTRRFRATVQNEIVGGSPRLVPGQVGVTVIDLGQRKQKIIPRDALVDTGRDTYVFVQTSPGRFAPISVKVLFEDHNRVGIDSQLPAGTSVVSGATFLIDAESRLRAAVAKPQEPPPQARLFISEAP